MQDREQFYATKQDHDELAARVAALEDASPTGSTFAPAGDHEHVAPGHNAESTAIVTGPVAQAAADHDQEPDPPA